MAGFEPATPGLEGQCPILARPHALNMNKRDVFKTSFKIIRSVPPHQ